MGETLYIEPGSPSENGYAESFVSRFRDELLAREEFDNLADARAYGVLPASVQDVCGGWAGSRGKVAWARLGARA